MKNLNQKASLLISMTILYVLIAFSVGFVLLNTMEMNESRRYYHSTSAFWLAEAGINMFIKNPSMLNGAYSKLISYGDGTVTLVQDDSKPMFRFITAIGQVGGTQRKVQIAYSANVPEAYRNSISSKGNITLNGKKSSFIINDKVRISGQLINNSKFGSSLFEDLKQNEPELFTSLNYISSDDNPQTEGLTSFIKNNQDVISNYSSSEVLHIKSNGTYQLPTDGSLKGKKIIFIEGDLGGGDVVIESNKIVAKDQNLTIIATGKVKFHQSGIQETNSQLNIISWGGYEESVGQTSSYTGMIYTHGKASFDNITASSINNGSLIADGGILFGEVWSTKIFNYADMTKGGAYPPGFEKLVGGSLSIVSPYPVLWREVPN